jgi:hypothetical protein
MNTGQRFRQCVESQDMEGARALFAEEIEFRSPAVFKPYEGLDAIMFILENVEKTFENFRYVDQASEGNSHMLRFEANVGDKSLEGVDLLQTNDDGLITNFTVMIRPLSGTIALSEAMKVRFEAALGNSD